MRQLIPQISYLFLPRAASRTQLSGYIVEFSRRPDSAEVMPEGVRTMMEEILPPEDVSRFSAVLAQEEFHIELERLFRSEWLLGTPQEVHIQPRKAHKDRCTFEIAVKTESTWHRVIGKVYAVDRSDVLSAMQAVVQSGFGPDAEFAIPRPLAYLSSFHVLFEEKVQGTWAMEVFLKRDGDEQIATARRCGAWLGRFHNIAPRLGNVAEPRGLVPQLSYWTDQIKNSGEPFVHKGESLLQKLEAAMPATGTAAVCAGHGSYMPEHVFLAGRRTIAIDLDEHDVADPGRDLAWFVVSLQRLGLKHLGSLHAHDTAVDAFLQTYAAGRPRDALKYLPFFKAAECLHRANRDLYKRTIPIPQWADIMLDEGLRAL